MNNLSFVGSSDKENYLSFVGSSGEEFVVPNEILVHVFSFLPNPLAVSRVSKQFYGLTQSMVFNLGTEYFNKNPSTLSGKLFFKLTLNNQPDAKVVATAFRIAQAVIQLLPDYEELAIRAFDFARIDDIFEAVPEEKKKRAITRSAHGNLECLQALLMHVSADQVGRAFWTAAMMGHLACLQAIIDSERFSEISPVMLGTALLMAASGGHGKCLQAIISSCQFSNIRPYDLRRAYDSAKEEVHPECMQLLAPFLRRLPIFLR